MTLTNRDIVELTDWRRHLHQWPEVSGQEVRTAAAVAAMLQALGPDQLVTGLGGHGVAAVFAGAAPGPTVMFRAELDGLPIPEVADLPWRSQVVGHGHMCGHDGHMAILAGLGRLLGRVRPARGRVILLFQPAEEDGSGAAAVLADPRFAALVPDWSFALHNLPGVPLGHVMLDAGPANCASRGLKIRLDGKTAHAATPDSGVSPAPALARLIPALQALGPGGALGADFRLVTVTHARLGEPTFGIAPGTAELWVTLRTITDAAMAGLMNRAERLVHEQSAGLQVTFSTHDDFAACHNDPAATDRLAHAVAALNLVRAPSVLPLRASEDFGRFGAVSASAMLYLGAGLDRPMLHNPDYDFPDALIGPGVALFEQVMRDLSG